MTETYTEKLARWANTLNIWEWPEDLQGRPDGWDELPEIIKNGQEFAPNKYTWSGSIINEIKKTIGHKEFLRWHWIHNLSKTNEEFETWYEERNDA